MFTQQNPVFANVTLQRSIELDKGSWNVALASLYQSDLDHLFKTELSEQRYAQFIKKMNL